DCVSVAFMKVDDQGKLDTKDSYQTPWIGGQGGREPVQLGSTGTRVIGIIVKAKKSQVTGLGLLLESAAVQRDTRPGDSATPVPSPAPSPAGGPRLTRENFDRIQSGMTEDQVTGILGSPGGRSQKTVTSSGVTNQTIMLVWRQPSAYLTITVTLRNQRVSGKNW